MSTSLPAQSDIFGGKSHELNVYAMTRKIMQSNPIVWKSHRLLMKAAARAIGFKIDDLDSDQRALLEKLFELSPDFERAARKVREEDRERRARLGPSDARAELASVSGAAALDFDGAVEAIQRDRKFTKH